MNLFPDTTVNIIDIIQDINTKVLTSDTTTLRLTMSHTEILSPHLVFSSTLRPILSSTTLDNAFSTLQFSRRCLTLVLFCCLMLYN